MDFDYPDMPFPIDRCSKRVANALLREFDGRVPTLAEVMAYRDNDWLGTPGFGRKALDEIKEIKTTLAHHLGRRVPGAGDGHRPDQAAAHRILARRRCSGFTGRGR